MAILHCAFFFQFVNNFTVSKDFCHLLRWGGVAAKLMERAKELTPTHRIHGNGIFTYMNLEPQTTIYKWLFRVPGMVDFYVFFVRKYTCPMDPLG